MENWQRKILFFSFVFLFLILGPILVLYSFGYRFDFEKKKITQTGGIFVKGQPKELKIFINGKFVKKTDFFFGSALIENLLPKKYKIRIEKEGFFPWEKELEVEEKKVTEIKNLILFPKNLNLYPIFKNISDFWFSDDGKKIILKEGEKNWSLKFYSLENKVKSHLIDDKEISKEKAEILNLKFLENQTEIELEIKIGKERKKFLLDLTKTPQLREVQQIRVPENILCYQLKDGVSYFLENSGFLFKGSSNFENKEKLNEKPILAEKECSIENLGEFLFLKNGRDLFLFDSETKSFEKILDGVRELKAFDSKKFLIFSNSEILILEKGKKEFLNRFSEKIENLYWINENYFIFQTENKIKVSETDTRDKVNVFEILEIKVEKFFFNQKERKIYLLKDGTLFQSDPIF